MRQRPFLIGLTGSIGMGKSTTARMFADEGIPVWDADATVHGMYCAGGAAVEPMRGLRADMVVNDEVDRSALRSWISEDPAALGRIESVVHPLVAADRRKFIEAATSYAAVLDVPLLFETAGEKEVDAVAVVSTPLSIQRERVLKRGNISRNQFETLLARQVPDSEKRARADYIIETITLDGARAAVRSCLRDIEKRLENARSGTGYGNDGP